MSNMQKEEGPSVLISGASFAGLSSARWMSRLGYTVTVVEMASELRRGGTPVNIRGAVIDVVRQMGLLDRIKAMALPARPVTFLDAEGQPLQQQLSAEQQEPELEADYEIERDALLDMLFYEVKGQVESVFGDTILSVAESEDSVDVVFTSEKKQSFSLVLGFDGVYSTVRRLCFGDETDFVLFLENYFSLSIVPRVLLKNDTALLFSVPGKTVMLNAYNGKTYIGFYFASSEEIPYDRRRQDEQKASSVKLLTRASGEPVNCWVNERQRELLLRQALPSAHEFVDEGPHRAGRRRGVLTVASGWHGRFGSDSGGCSAGPGLGEAS